MAWRNEYNQNVLDLVKKMPGIEIWCDPSQGSDGGSGSIFSPVKTLVTALGMARAGKNDVIYLVGGASAASLAVNLDWNKNFTHLIGLGAELHNGGRCRIAPSATFSPMFTVSARGCKFHNIHWQNSTTSSATNLITVSVTYEGNACNEFNQCDIEGPLGALQAAAAFATLNIANHSQDNTFRKTRIGQWTVQANLSAGALIKFGGDNCVSTFEDCTILGNSTADWIPVGSAANLGGDGSFVQFIKCRFLSLANGVTCTKVFGSPTNGSLVLLQDCVRLNFTDWGANTALIYSTMPSANEAGGIGIVPSV